jgi:hypothetical protein
MMRHDRRFRWYQAVTRRACPQTYLFSRQMLGREPSCNRPVLSRIQFHSRDQWRTGRLGQSGDPPAGTLNRGAPKDLTKLKARRNGPTHTIGAGDDHMDSCLTPLPVFSPSHQQLSNPSPDALAVSGNGLL